MEEFKAEEEFSEPDLNNVQRDGPTLGRENVEDALHVGQKEQLPDLTQYSPTNPSDNIQRRYG